MEHPLALGSLGWFLGWLVAVAVLFVLGLRLPLAPRISRSWRVILEAWLIVLGVAVVVLANLGLALHDTHVDLTREKIYTPAPAAMAVVDALRQPVRITYFYQGEDPNAKRAKDILEIMSRRNPRLRVRSVDPDQEPTLAENFGIKVYNAAVLEAGGRRILVRGTDETEFAIGIQRVLRERVVSVCFAEGHGEYPSDNFEFHTHLEGVAGHSHDDARSAVVETSGHGIGRLRRSLEALGFEIRTVSLAGAGSLADCALVIVAGSRTTYLPLESLTLEAYLQQGGALLFMADLGFVLEPGLAGLFEQFGATLPQAVVIDPSSHYGTDREMVAVTGYDPHPSTRNVSHTFFPGARPLALRAPAAGIRTVPLLTSSVASTAEPVTPVAERQPAGAGPEAAPVPDTGPQVLAAAIDGSLGEGSKPFRAILIGDADFASNSFYPYMANSDLALGMVRWLLRDEDAARPASRIPAPPLLALTKAQMQLIFFGVEVLLPLAVIAAGTLVWWRRWR